MVSAPLPPGPRTGVPGAHLLAFSRDMLGFVCRLKHDYSDVVAFRLGPECTVFLSYPSTSMRYSFGSPAPFRKAAAGPCPHSFWEKACSTAKVRGISTSAVSCHQPFIANASRSMPP